MGNIQPFSAAPKETCPNCRWRNYDSFHDEAYCTNPDVDADVVYSDMTCELWSGEEEE